MQCELNTGFLLVEKEKRVKLQLLFFEVSRCLCSYKGVCLFVSGVNEMQVPGVQKLGSVHFCVSVV